MNDMTAGPQLRPVFESTFRTHDGAELFYGTGRQFMAPRVAPSYFSIAVTSMAPAWRTWWMKSICPILHFSRGMRAASDVRPASAGYAESFGALVKDVRRICGTSRANHGIAVEDIAVIAQSVGAVLVSTWVHDYAPKIRCMVLASPAFKVKLYVPLACRGSR